MLIKLKGKAQEGIFVGYDSRSKGYKVYVDGENVTISRTVKFIEGAHLNNPNYEIEIDINN